MSKTRARIINSWQPGQPLPAREHKKLADTPPMSTTKCPVCSEVFDSGLKMQCHHDEQHSVRNLDTVTVIVRQCPRCKGTFVRSAQQFSHVCPEKSGEENAREIALTDGSQLAMAQKLLDPGDDGQAQTNQDKVVAPDGAQQCSEGQSSETYQTSCSTGP